MKVRDLITRLLEEPMDNDVVIASDAGWREQIVEVDNHYSLHLTRIWITKIPEDLKCE